MTVTSRRRGRGEARRAIIEAARELFAKKGYDRTSFREIAQAAGVNEALIYRGVGSKEQLFKEAVIEPYHAFISAWVDRWREEATPLSNQQMMDRFTTEFHSLLKEHRELILALAAARAFGDADVHPDGGSLLSEELDRLVEQTRKEASLRGFDEADIFIGVRCVVGAIMAMVLFDEWLLPPKGKGPSEQSMLSGISRIVVAGMESSRQPDRAPREASRRSTSSKPRTKVR